MTKHKNCEACNDLGFILRVTNLLRRIGTHEEYEIQRCDTCKRFSDDSISAKEAYRLAVIGFEYLRGDYVPQ